MPNMGYCRFENTLRDLRDCHDNMDEPLSAAETQARLKLIRLCIDIATDYASEIGAECSAEVDQQAFKDALRRAHDPATA